MSKNSVYANGHSYFCIDYAQEDRAHSDTESMGERGFHEFNPFRDPTSKAIGHTHYSVSISCQGKESILGIIRRLLLDDPLFQMTLLPHDISGES